MAIRYYLPLKITEITSFVPRVDTNNRETFVVFISYEVVLATFVSWTVTNNINGDIRDIYIRISHLLSFQKKYTALLGFIFKSGQLRYIYFLNNTLTTLTTMRYVGDIRTQAVFYYDYFVFGTQAMSYETVQRKIDEYCKKKNKYNKSNKINNVTALINL